MKEVTVKVFEYQELSPEAKQAVYNRWLEHADYGWTDENIKVLNTIAEDTNVHVSNWEYGNGSYHYHLQDPTELTFFNYSRDEYDHMVYDYEDIKGLKAAKIAMDMVYKLTAKRKIFRGRTHPQIGAGSTWWEYRPKDGQKFKTSRLEYAERCFTGFYASQTFADALWDSVRSRGACKFVSLKDHLEAAFSALFHDFDDDYDASFTQEYFEESSATEDQFYTEDGDYAPSFT